jgi:TIR domain/Sel1 repeat
MAVSGSVAAAFISYSREDSEFALRLARDLKRASAQVWLDQLDIRPGQPWDNAIEDALLDAQEMLLILSPSSARSENVRNEISSALEQGKIIVPILYRDCVVPLRLQRTQRIDFRGDYDHGLAATLDYLKVIKTGQGGSRPVAAPPLPEARFAFIPDATHKPAQPPDAEPEAKVEVVERATNPLPPDASLSRQPARESAVAADSPAAAASGFAKSQPIQAASLSGPQHNTVAPVTTPDSPMFFMTDSGENTPARHRMLIIRAAFALLVIIAALLFLGRPKASSPSSRPSDTPASASAPAATLTATAIEPAKLPGTMESAPRSQPGIRTETASPSPPSNVSLDATQCHQGSAFACSRLENECDDGSGKACAGIGDAYAKGLGVPRDTSKASIYYRKACGAGDSSACKSADRIAAAAATPPPANSPTQPANGAAQSMNKPPQPANASAQTNIPHGNTANLVQAACDNGWADSCSNLAGLYQNGTGGLPRDPDKAAAYQKRACSLNYSYCTKQ